MRWSATLSISLLFRAREATATPWSDSPDLPSVYLYNPGSPSVQPGVKLDHVDAHVASLIFAHRLGIAHYLSIGEVADVDLQHLNKYTTASEAPLSVTDAGKHLFVVVDGAQQPAYDQRSVPGLSTFHLSVSPSAEDGMELFSKFASYVEKTHGVLRQSGASQYSLALGSKDVNKATSPHAASIPADEMNETLSGQWRNLGTKQQSFDMIYKEGSHIGSVLEAAIQDGVALTLIVNPTPTRSSGEGRNVYGGFPEAIDKLLGRRQEAPLLEFTSAVDNAAPTGKGGPQSFATNATRFPLTAQCYDDADSCMSETNSCSGHGKCVLARKGPTSSEGDDAAECYQCKCGKDERKNPDGSIKTTYYGGSACQKTDISAPFWILTLTAGSLFALVGFGVSMLYAMGNAELPSVIGAGVSGPKAK